MQYHGIAEMAQWFRELTELPEDKGQIHKVKFRNLIVHKLLGNPMPMCELYGTRHTCGVQKLMHPKCLQILMKEGLTQTFRILTV